HTRAPHPTDPIEPRPASALAAATAGAAGAWFAAHLLSSGIAPAIVAIAASLLILALPRIGWMVLTAGLALAAVSEHRPGGALLLVLGAGIPILLIPRSGT